MPPVPDSKTPAFRIETISTFTSTKPDGKAIVYKPKDKGIKTKIVAKSTPITAQLKEYITRIQLSTVSHDQGFVSDTSQGSWSWFDLAILENEHADRPKLNTDGFPMTWRSHANRLGHLEFSQYFGFVFDQGSPLIKSLEVGNVIAVVMCTCFVDWRNHCKAATMKIKVAQDPRSVLEDRFLPAPWTLDEQGDRSTADHDELDDVYTFNSSSRADVAATGRDLVSRVWLKTPPLDEHLAKRIEEIQLYTLSCDQGRWVSFEEDSSWSWFDVMILQSATHSTPKVIDGREMVWSSHSNRKAHEDLHFHEGKVFKLAKAPSVHGSQEFDDEILNSIEPGNVLAVRVCAQFPGWENHVQNGRFIIRAKGGTPTERTPQPKITALSNGKTISDIAKALLEAEKKAYNAKIQAEKELQGPEQKEANAPPPYKPSLDISNVIRADEAIGNEVKERPLRLLSLDGGGVRGASSLEILKHILGGDDYANAGRIRPYQYFDMIAGTSTGGLLALMLGRFKMSIEEVEQEYDRISKNVFGEQAHYALTSFLTTKAKFSHEKLADNVKRVVKSRTGSEDTTMWEEGPCKVFLTTTRMNDIQRPVLLRTYTNPREPAIFGNWQIWEAARATSAAPWYFDPVEVATEDAQRRVWRNKFVDGGLQANNPALLLTIEAGKVYGQLRPVGCLVSIGTGIPPKEKLGQVGLFSANDFVTGLISAATQSEATHDQVRDLSRAYIPDPLDDSKYFRFNLGKIINKGGQWDPEYVKGATFHEENYEKLIDLADWKKMKTLREETKKYMQDADNGGKLAAKICGDKLRKHTPDLK